MPYNKIIRDTVLDTLERLSWKCSQCPQAKVCEEQSSGGEPRYCWPMIEAAILGFEEWETEHNPRTVYQHRSKEIEHFDQKYKQLFTYEDLELKMQVIYYDVVGRTHVQAEIVKKIESQKLIEVLRKDGYKVIILPKEITDTTIEKEHANDPLYYYANGKVYDKKCYNCIVEWLDDQCSHEQSRCDSCKVNGVYTKWEINQWQLDNGQLTTSDEKIGAW